MRYFYKVFFVILKYLGLDSNMQLVCACEVGLAWVHTARHPRLLLRQVVTR